MQTVTLKIDESIEEKFLWLLQHFSKKEIEILDKTVYKSDDEYLRSMEGMEKSILEAANEPIENYTTIDKLDW